MFTARVAYIRSKWTVAHLMKNLLMAIRWPQLSMRWAILMKIVRLLKNILMKNFIRRKPVSAENKHFLMNIKVDCDEKSVSKLRILQSLAPRKWHLKIVSPLFQEIATSDFCWLFPEIREIRPSKAFSRTWGSPPLWICHLEGRIHCLWRSQSSTKCEISKYLFHHIVLFCWLPPEIKEIRPSKHHFLWWKTSDE